MNKNKYFSQTNTHTHIYDTRRNEMAIFDSWIYGNGIN